MVGADWRVRTYRPGDESALVELWNEALPYDPVDEGTLAARVLADANFDPGGLFVAEPLTGGAGPGFGGDGAGRPLLGFVLALSRRVPLGPGEGLEPENGWITAFGVRPSERRRGVATALVEAACGALGGRGCLRVEVSPYAPGYFWPGVDRALYPEAAAFLARRGFATLYEAVAMGRSLVGYRPPEDALGARRRLEREGVRFGALDAAHVVPLLEWSNRVFHADWARAVREAVARRLPWRRTLLALGPGGDLLGFAQYGCYDRSSDRFGPFGVDPAARGRGIGTVLLHECLQAMQREDLKCTWFLWTGERSPAGALYRKAGFYVTRRFALFRRPLSGAAASDADGSSGGGAAPPAPSSAPE